MSEGEDRDTKVVHTIYAIFMGIVVVFGSIWVMTAGHPIG
jgi:cytochrome aa3-600 menaquinol oxidase subunit IV